jgi:hypothetical protein
VEVRSLVEGEWRVALYQGDELVRLYSVDWHGDLAAIYEKVIYEKVICEKVGNHAKRSRLRWRPRGSNLELP